ncbi:hypothetical protein BDF20DRAFT_806397, partial [Mycotypha africana]|uniref:uncharacterized protein n=1 Tax=Mycotypha africana TaxID=64632 RepID=UPI0023010341
RLPPIGQFIRELYSDPNVGMTKKKTHSLTCAVKLFALIYLYRLKSKLPKHARGGADTPYRLILAALLTSSKYLSETGTGLTSLQLSQLSQSVFTANEINQMERSFLGLLKYDLWVSAGDIQSFMRLYGYTLHMDV